VNALRAEHACAVQAVPDDDAAVGSLARGQSAVPADPREDQPEPDWGDVPEVAPARVSAFVQLADDVADATLPPELDDVTTAKKGTLVTVELPASDAVELGKEDWALNVELGQPLATPAPDVSDDEVSEPGPELRQVTLPDGVPELGTSSTTGAAPAGSASGTRAATSIRRRPSATAR
jgi:hypothetical protein